MLCLKSQFCNAPERGLNNNKMTSLYAVPPIQKRTDITRHWWLIPIILAIQEALMRGLLLEASPGQIVHETLS
jgi:hypothetical protein